MTDLVVQFPTGALQLEQLVALFQVLPVDLTFVDHEDRVRFFSEGKKRVFPRTTSVIGRSRQLSSTKKHASCPTNT